MSPVLPFDVIALIIDIIGENQDINLLKELALVSHSFHQICSKHLFATVDLNDTFLRYNIASLKKGFVKLLESRPDVAKYIRKLTYKVNHINDGDHLLSPILLNLLPKISRLNCLTITATGWDWNNLNSTLRSALLHLMHLPTINHIELSHIRYFPLSILTPSVNLHRLEIFYLESSPEIIMEMMPKIREFRTSYSSLLITKLLHAKTQDGQSAFNLMDLRQLSISFNEFDDERNIRYLLQNAKLLENFDLSVSCAQSLVGILSLSPRTLKVLDLEVAVYDRELGGLCEELEALAGHNTLKALFLTLHLCDNVDKIEYHIGPIMQDVENVLVKPGWSALKQVSFKVTMASWENRAAELYEALQSLPDEYLSHLSKLESIAFNYSICLLVP